MQRKVDLIFGHFWKQFQLKLCGEGAKKKLAFSLLLTTEEAKSLVDQKPIILF